MTAPCDLCFRTAGADVANRVTRACIINIIITLMIITANNRIKNAKKKLKEKKIMMN